MVNISQSLVSIICLCYNHEDYLVESLDSAYFQSHKNIQLIIVDDLSTDNSKNEIENWISSKKKNFLFIKNDTNLGHTKSFNKALKYAKGDYVVDLATDDFLHFDFVKNHLLNFKQKKEYNAGVSYCNVELVNNNKEHIKYHWSVGSNLKANTPPNDGNIYTKLLTSYYLNPTGVFAKKSVYEDLNGYDSELDFEDFDFWIRSSIKYNYIYADFIGVKKLILETSHSTKALTTRKNRKRKNNSIYKICRKAYEQNSNKEHKLALKTRIIHEWKIVTKKMDINLTFKYFILFLKNEIFK